MMSFLYVVVEESKDVVDADADRQNKQMVTLPIEVNGKQFPSYVDTGSTKTIVDKTVVDSTKNTDPTLHW